MNRQNGKKYLKIFNAKKNGLKSRSSVFLTNHYQLISPTFPHQSLPVDNSYVYSQITIDAPKPDLVIYLQSPVDVLMDRISNRGRNIEQSIDRNYLELVNEDYSEFFLYYDDSPLLIVNCTEFDFINNENDYLSLIDYLLNVRSGRCYFNPTIFS